MNGKCIWRCWLLAGLGACQPADKPPPAAVVPADTAALAGQVDSSHQVSQDGLDHVPLNTGTFQQLPPELTFLLDRHHPGWVLPEISVEALKQADRQAQGPYYVRADFDRNGLQDFAVQFQIRDSVLVAVYLWQRQQLPRKFILARQPLAQVKGEKQSRLVISQDSPATAGTAAAPAIRLTQKDLAAGKKQQTRVFVFEQDTFSLAAPKPRQGP